MNVCQWKWNANEHEAKTGERFSSQIRRSIYLNNRAPMDVGQHLMLNEQRLCTAEAIPDEIEEHWESMEEFNKDAV